MSKVIKENVECRFKALCDAQGFKIATSSEDHGAYQLDYVRQYGGYRIERIDHHSTGVHTPFGEKRFSPSEMYNAINFALRAIQIDRKGENHASYWPDKKVA